MLVRCLLCPRAFKLPARAAVRCPFSEQAKHPLLASQFFMLGPRSTVGPSKPASKLFVTGLSQIQKLQALLQEKGQRLLKKYRQDQLCSQLSSLSQKGEVKQYLQVYGSLVEVVEKSQIQGEQTYNIIGWYNMTPLKRTLVQKLFQGRLQELPMLIESLSWMNSTQGSIEDFFLSKDEYQEKSRTFYRKIPYSLTIDQLKKIDNILKPTSYLDQRKFYQYYLRRNLQKILRDAHSSRDSQFGDDIVWLLEASVKAMNDCQISLSKVEKFLLTWRPKLSPSSLGKLINVYCQLGKNNPFLYEAYLKPYLQQQLKQPAGAISALKFIVSSQTQDKVLLHSCCQHINLSFNSSALSEAQLSQLHTYLHYLQISGERTNLHKELQKKLHVGCSQQNCIPSINSLVLGQKANKPTVSKMKTSKAKYISECLQEEAERKIAKFEISEKDEFKEEIGFKLPGTNFTQLDIYTNLTFCNFQLQYFLYNRVKNEVVNVETRCEAYIFSSGRLRRSVEMRDQILEHYGITVKHVNTRKYLNKGLKLSQEEQMMVSKRQKKVKS